MDEKNCSGGQNLNDQHDHVPNLSSKLEIIWHLQKRGVRSSGLNLYAAFWTSLTTLCD